MKWKINRNMLVSEDGKTTKFEYEVKDVLEAKGVTIVLLKVPPSEAMTQNVFGVSPEGRILWQIEKIPETSSDETNTYVGMNKTSDQIVRIGNWNGLIVEIDPTTGKVTRKIFGK